MMNKLLLIAVLGFLSWVANAVSEGSEEGVPGTSNAVNQTQEKKHPRRLDLNGAPLSVALDLYSELSGSVVQNIESLECKMTIHARGLTSSEECLELLTLLLEVNGIALREGENALFVESKSLDYTEESEPTPLSRAHPERDEKQLSLSFISTPVQQILDILSELTGRHVVLQTLPLRMPASVVVVDLVPSDRVSESEAIELIQKALGRRGFVLTPIGDRFLKVTYREAAREEDSQ